MHTPNIPKRLLSTLMPLAIGLLGCGDTVQDAGDETTGSELPGTLVITEVVANVPGDDAGLEWFEIYNASSETVDLEGMTLIYEKVDGTGHKTHTIGRSVEVPAGGYVVVGSLLDELADGSSNVDYGYAGELGDFGNSAGYLAIATASEELIDDIYYDGPSETASRTFDGSQTPDALANNELGDWCDSHTEFIDGFAATPGVANDVCGGAETCLQDGEPIAIVHPQVGDLIITEVLPNPSGEDELLEWFELRSIATTDFHLNGLDIGRQVEDGVVDTITGLDCITLSPEQYVIVVKSSDPIENGGLPAEPIVWTADASLDLTIDGALWVGVAGEVVDAVTWTSPDESVARQLGGLAFDPVANDDEANWCDATEPYGAGDLGTPGAENTACPLAPPAEGSCYENGEQREIVPVAMGELELTEIMSNPADASEGPAEWFEVLANGSGDLNGLEITKSGMTYPIAFPGECLTVAAGDYIVFAHKLPADGGPPQVDVVFKDPSSINNAGDLGLGYGGMIWDQTSWDATTNGYAWSKDIANDVWCDAVDPYDDVINYGTPGAANPACGGGPQDGCIDPDNMLMRMPSPPMPGQLTLTEVMPNPSLGEPGAEWFEIYASVAFDLNGVELGKLDAISYTFVSDMCLEVAADTYVVLARSDDPLLDCMLPFDYLYPAPSLSNADNELQIGYGGVVLSEYAWGSTTNGVALGYDMNAMAWCEATEPFGCGDLGSPGAPNPPCGVPGQCFDPLLNMMRDPVVPVSGDLVITELMADPSVVADAMGEWFEVRALGAFDLYGLWLGKDYVGEAGNPLHVIDGECMEMAPNDVALFAINGDPMVNGNLPPVDYVYDFGLSNNVATGLYIASEVELLDELFWATSAAGRSTSLDPGSYDPALNDNTDMLPWCDMLVGQETPGADNMQCP